MFQSGAHLRQTGPLQPMAHVQVQQAERGISSMSEGTTSTSATEELTSTDEQRDMGKKKSFSQSDKSTELASMPTK